MDERELYRQLSGLVDPAALCWLLRERGVSPQSCDNSLRHTQAILTEYHVSGARLDRALDLLGELGGNCDCEVYLNLCGRLREFEGQVNG